ncbi:hypothetical protein J1N35_042913 [Gossypium stocksii]|uniref:BED-type domain-containing protein n=1 Tax=Gossypium stocksii TaxID=47602 RepID=A0A9D3ZEH9_9ROSI|nr:hypothetical protein J1N35_042913 [Gossypium stocksii]
MASSNSPIHVDDGFNEYESAAKRQKSTTSKVWDEMTKLECENKYELKAQCNHCNTILSAKSSSETSHLRRHLNSCLKKVNKDISQYTIATQPLVGAARDVLMYYAKERDRVKEKLAKAPSLICLTSDNWNSKHTNDEYICITAHWVDENWKLQKRIIRFRALFPPYDGLNIADELVLCLSQWVKAGLELADDVVGKIRNGIKYIKKLGIRRKRFYDVADKSFHLNVTKKLRQDVCVRWNSTYLILESSLYYKDVLDYWGQRDKDYQIFALSNEEWRNVAIRCKFLKVFYDVTCVLSGYPTANLYFRAVWKVHKVLLDKAKEPARHLQQPPPPAPSSSADLQNETNTQEIGLGHCKNGGLQGCSKAGLSVLLPATSTTEHGGGATECRNLRLFFHEYVKKLKSTSSSLVGSSNVSDKSPVDSSLDEHNVNSVDFGRDFDESDDYKWYLNESNTRSEKSQLDIYLEEPELELNSQIDVLDYWSKSSARYNELSLLARDLLAIPISTVASESAFSMGKKVITPLRNSLKPKTVQAVVCLDDWMRAKGFSIEIGCKNDKDDENDASSIAF